MTVMHVNYERDLRIEHDLRKAVDANDYTACYQPIILLQNGKPVSAETLFRCTAPALKPISTAELIATAEKTELINTIGERMITLACQQLKQWQHRKFMINTISVNCSAVQLLQPNFHDVVQEILNQHQVPSSSLVLEITETLFMSQFKHPSIVLHTLKSMGVKIALDDFGTGYSSLSYIKDYPFSILKIDGSFISGLPDSYNSRELVKAMIGLGKALHISVIAEGVETRAQAQFLIENGCEYAQGFLYNSAIIV